MPLKPGFMDWHTETCDLVLKYTSGKGAKITANSTPYRAYFCNTHNQWCYEHIVKVTFKFEDGTEVVRERNP